jgi:NO-binding membrane sensor protein with MHYT domain
MLLSGVHDTVLVALSIFIATFASYTAFDLAGRVRMATGRARIGWLAAAAIVLGGGIWASGWQAWPSAAW